MTIHLAPGLPFNVESRALGIIRDSCLNMAHPMSMYSGTPQTVGQAAVLNLFTPGTDDLYDLYDLFPLQFMI